MLMGGGTETGWPQSTPKRLNPAVEDERGRLVCGCVWFTGYFSTGMQSLTHMHVPQSQTLGSIVFN